MVVGKEAGREGRSTDIMAISFQLFNTERARARGMMTMAGN